MSGSMQTRISIYADDKASASFRKVAGEADNLVNKLLGMGPKVGDVLGNLGLGSLGIGLGLKELTGLVRESSLAAARYETLGLAMVTAGDNAGYSAEQMHKAERALVRNGIALQDARQVLTNFATSNLEVARSAELARAAQDVAVVAHMDSSEALAKMVHGIESAQTQVLRTIGLSVNFEQVYAKTAQTLGKNVSALTENEKTQARFNATLEAAARYAGLYDIAMTTAGKQLGSFTRHFANFKSLIGSVSLDAMTTAIFGVNESFESLNERLMDMKESGELEEVSRKVGGGFKLITDNVDKAIVGYGAYAIASRLAGAEVIKNTTELLSNNGVVSQQIGLRSGLVAVLDKEKMAYALLQKSYITNATLNLKGIREDITNYQALIGDLKGQPWSIGNNALIKESQQKIVELRAQERRHVQAIGTAQNALNASLNQGTKAMNLFARTGKGLMSVVNALGGPWVVGITAATTALYYLSTQETHAQKIASEYAKEIREVGNAYEEAGKKAAGYATEEKNILINQQQKVLEAAQKDLEQSQKEFMRLAQPGNIGFWSVDTSEIIELLRRVGDGSLSFEVVWRELARIQNGMKVAGQGGKEFHEMLDDLIQKAQGATGVEKRVNDTTASLEKLCEGLLDVDEAAKGAFASLSSLGDINFDNLTANVEFEIGKIGLSDRNKAVLDNLLRNKVLEQQQVHLDGADFSLTGLTPEAEQKVEELAVAYGELFDKQQSARGGAKNLQSALSGLNDEMSRLLMTEQEYARYQYGVKFAQLRKDLGAASPALQQWTQLQEMALDAGYTDSNAAAGHIREVAKAIGEIGLTEKEKQLKAFNEEMARLQALMDSFQEAGIPLQFSPEQFEAYKSQRSKEITTGRNIEQDRQSLLEFEKEFLTIMQSSEAAQIQSIQEKAAVYISAGAEIVRVAQWQSEMELQYSRDAFDGMKRGLRDYANEATNMANNTSSTITSIFDGVSNAFSFTTGKMKIDWSNMLDSIMNQSWKALVMNPLLGGLSQGLGSLVGNMFSGGSSAVWTSMGNDFSQNWQDSLKHAGGADWLASFHHTGGIVGMGSIQREIPSALFDNAPRYHTGGPILKPGEVPIIAEVGERMLTKKQNQLWEQMQRGGPHGPPVEISVVIKNESGQPLQASSSQTQWAGDMKSAVITIILDAVNRNYMGARDILRGGK